MRPSNDLRYFQEATHNPSSLALMNASGGEEIPLLDFCLPTNSYYPGPRLREKLARRLRETLAFYPSRQEVLAEAVAEVAKARPDQIVVGNGAGELIAWVDELFVRGGIAIPVPTWGGWVERARAAGKKVMPFELSAADGFHLDGARFAGFVRESGADVGVLVNPNNPTGGYLRHDAVVAVLESLADVPLVVVDESFIDFAYEDAIPSLAAEVERFPNLLVVRSVGKCVGLHGLRLGYGVASTPLARRLRAALPAANVNALAEMVAFDIRDHRAEYEAARVQSIRNRAALSLGLEAIPALRVLPSYANFVLVEVTGHAAADVRNRLLAEHGILVRHCALDADDDGAGRFLRIASGAPEDNGRLLDALRAVLREEEATIRASRYLKLKLRFDPEWAAVESARAVVHDWLETSYRDPDLRDALTMVASELLENAVRHATEAGREGAGTVAGDPGSSPGEPVVLELSFDENEVSISVENWSARSREDVEKLEEKLDWITACGSPEAAYLETMQTISRTPGKIGGLGLVRIAYEGRCGMAVEDLGNGRLRMRASRYVGA